MGTILPAEWTPQDAVMLTWPRQDGDFKDHFRAVEQSFLTIAAVIAQYEPVHINVQCDAENLRQRLLRNGIPAERLRIYEVASDDVWARDHGPISVFRDHQLVHLDFVFNGWGGKYPSRLDNELTRKLATLGAWNAPVQSLDFVLEGGAIDSDGQGTLLTTESCLLNSNRNPGLTRADVEERLWEYLGIERVLWVRSGDLAGDDTDGHIDTLARFCNPNLIAYQACDDPSDAHFRKLSVLSNELSRLRTSEGLPYELLALPLPAAIHSADGRRLPASYANFLILNNAVLMPVYGDAADELALKSLRHAFRDRRVIGINCRALIEQYGSLHCVTMQIPSKISGAVYVPPRSSSPRF